MRTGAEEGTILGISLEDFDARRGIMREENIIVVRKKMK